MPRGDGRDRLPRAVVLVQQRARLLRAAHAGGEERLVLAAQHQGARRRIELRVLDVPPARDAVDVLAFVRTIARRGRLLELALALGELLLTLHAPTLDQRARSCTNHRFAQTLTPPAPLSRRPVGRGGARRRSSSGPPSSEEGTRALGPPSGEGPGVRVSLTSAAAPHPARCGTRTPCSSATRRAVS